MTLLPALSVKPPVARSDDIALVRFRGPAPSRRIALVWRRTSAMATFLGQLAVLVRGLPKALFSAKA
jgi:LysR family hydrogen peroxide-inducible transcriptional activator